MPLITRDRAPQGGVARGALGVYTTSPRTFSDWDTRLLSSLANHAAIALQQAEALEQLKAAQERQAVAETFAVLGDIAANLLHRVNNLIGVIPVRAQGILDKRPALQADAYVEHGPARDRRQRPRRHGGRPRIDGLSAAPAAATHLHRDVLPHGLRPLNPAAQHRTEQRRSGGAAPGDGR